MCDVMILMIVNKQHFHKRDTNHFAAEKKTTTTMNMSQYEEKKNSSTKYHIDTYILNRLIAFQ